MKEPSLSDLIEGAVDLVENAVTQAVRLAWTQAGKEGVAAMLDGFEQMLKAYREQVSV